MVDVIHLILVRIYLIRIVIFFYIIINYNKFFSGNAKNIKKTKSCRRNFATKFSGAKTVFTFNKHLEIDIVVSNFRD